jgi:preprotein translocase subunit YajC
MATKHAFADGAASPRLHGSSTCLTVAGHKMFDWSGLLPGPSEQPSRILAVFISQAYAQTAAAGGAESSLMSLLPLVLMFVVLYFIMIRPQMKKQKEMKAMIEALAKGDEVVIAGGVVGRIAKLGDSFLEIEVANGVELQVQRGAVVQVLPKGTFK